MTNREVAELILRNKKLDLQAYEDLTQLASNLKESGDIKGAHEISKRTRERMTLDAENAEQMYALYCRLLLLDAPNYLDEFMLYVESRRPVEERFYQTRRKTLKKVVDALQALADDELDELFLSMPPRVGKSSLLVFTAAWLMGRKPGNPNLYSSYSDTITRSFFNAVLEIINDTDTYRYHDVFPKVVDLKTNAAEETIDINTKRHYPTLTCRSIDGTLNGACDVDGGFAIGDDFVSGIEEALSKDRMWKLWSKISNNYIPRGKETTKLVWVGTRWSITDPAGMRLDLLRNGAENNKRRFRIINIPAVNRNGESNFDYPYKKGFSTQMYLQLRENFERNNDMASWEAQYMGEPIERDGTLFSAADLLYFNETMPEGKPDRVFMTVDPAFGGGDFVAAPVCVQYGTFVYIPDVVYNSGDKRVTMPQIAMKAKQWGVTTIQIEANKSTESFAEGVEKVLREIDYHCTVITKQSASQMSKAQRIFDKAPDIRDMFVFLASPYRKNEYREFMANVFAYSPYLSNKGLRKQHDDAPDSLAQAAEFATNQRMAFKIFTRPW